MASNSAEAVITSGDTLQGILAALNRIEQLLQNQQDVLNRRREQGAEARLIREPVDVNEQTYGESSRSVSSRSTVERPVKCNVLDIPEFNDVIGGGHRILPDDTFPLFFSQAYLEQFERDEARRRIQAFANYTQILQRCRQLAKFEIIDFEIKDEDEILDSLSSDHDIHAEGGQCSVKYFRPSGELLHNTFAPKREAYGRVIICEGLSHVAKVLDSPKANVICPILFPAVAHRSCESIDIIGFEDDIASHLQDFMDLHISCKELPISEDRECRGMLGRFHTTFFELCEQPLEPDCWSSGRLYSRRGNNGQTFRKACLTIVVSFKTSSCDDTSPCWSLLILSPSGFYKPQPGFDINGERAESPRVEYQPNQRLWEESEETPLDRGHPEDAVLQVLIQSIKLIVTRWQNLYEVVRKECDGETVNFMDGEKYGDLLYDDGSFRRSRFYFWAIGCLNSFEQSIADTLSELALFRAAITHYHPWRFMAQECGFKEFDVSDSLNEEEIGELDRVYKRLEKIRLQLEKKCNEMKALRDGLFSASGVMESRQSRILGENVQLLTFVSIFFLPLAFCISLWSIPDMNAKYPGIATPISVAAVLGIVTYFIIFNLRLIISTLCRLLAIPKEFILRMMARDARKFPIDWSARAEEFEAFSHQDKNRKPSNWWLLIYTIRVLPRKIFNPIAELLKRLKKSKENSPKHNVKDGTASNVAVGHPDIEMGCI